MGNSNPPTKADHLGAYCKGCGRNMAGQSRGPCADCGEYFDPQHEETFLTRREVEAHVGSDELPVSAFCPSCGYDLRKLNSSHCPECGHRFRAASRLDLPQLLRRTRRQNAPMPWWTHPAFYLPVHYGLIVLFFFATFATFGSDVAVHLLYAATFPLIFLGYFHISLGGLGVILTPLLWWSALRWAIRLERRWL